MRGVYFLSDDRIINLTTAFLNSFRRYNPSIPLCLVPFNANIPKLSRLQEKYNFTIFSDNDKLSLCDRISERFHGHVVGAYRKLAMWEGEFDEFIYIDADSIVLENVGFAFQYLSSYDFVTGHSNIPGIVQFVWKDSIRGTGKLTEDQIGFSANTGLIVSKKKALNLEIVKTRVEAAVELAPHMVLFCMEQPFLNYLIVTSGRSFTSLLVLKKTGAAPHIPLDVWAGTKGGSVRGGKIFFKYSKPSPLMVQWSGEWQPRSFDQFLFRILRFLRIKRKDDQPIPRYFMPYGKLWRYYRHLHDL